VPAANQRAARHDRPPPGLRRAAPAPGVRARGRRGGPWRAGTGVHASAV